MPRRRVRIMPASLPAEVADNNAYSYGVLDGQTLHVSGMVAFAADGSYVGIGDVHTQAVQVFENLTAVVEAAGGTLDDVVSTTTYLAAAGTPLPSAQYGKDTSPARFHRPPPWWWRPWPASSSSWRSRRSPSENRREGGSA